MQRIRNRDVSMGDKLKKADYSQFSFEKFTGLKQICNTYNSEYINENTDSRKKMSPGIE